MPSHALFDSTRWTVVLEAAQSRSKGGPQVLADLYARYWPPLYAFGRRRGHGHENGQDLVQGFLCASHRTARPAESGSVKGPIPFVFARLVSELHSREIRPARTEKRGGRVEVVRLDWLVERSGERFWCAELHRLRGVFLTAMGADETQIEASFCEAISTAREQKSIFLEKRADASYAEYRRQKRARWEGTGSDYLFANAQKGREDWYKIKGVEGSRYAESVSCGRER